MAESTRAIVSAAGANLAIAVAKFVGGALTGSSATVSEGVHLVVDTANQGLLLFGLRRAKKPADARHPFGYGRELYFYSFVVALLIFLAGGLYSLYEGVEKIRQPEAIGTVALLGFRVPGVWINLSILGFAIVAEGTSLWVALREMPKGAGSPLSAIRRSKDPSLFVVVAEDTAAVAGLLIAFIGISLSTLLDQPRLDGAASLGIGAVLVGMAFFLMSETHGLLIGEAVAPEVRRAIEEAVEAELSVVGVNGLGLAAHLAIDASGLQPWCEGGRKQEVVEPQPGIATPAVALVAPERVHRIFGIDRAQRIAPAGLLEPEEGRSAPRVHERVLRPRRGGIDVQLGRGDVEVAGEHGRHAGIAQRSGTGDQTLEPSQLVVEFRTRPRIAVGQVDRSEDHARYRRLDVAGLRVGRVAGKIDGGDHRLASAASQDRDAVPAALPAPRRGVTRVAQSVDGKGALLRLEFLQTDHIGLRRREPRQQVRQALVDVVDIEGRDLQRVTRVVTLPVGRRGRKNRAR